MGEVIVPKGVPVDDCNLELIVLVAPATKRRFKEVEPSPTPSGLVQVCPVEHDPD